MPVEGNFWSAPEDVAKDADRIRFIIRTCVHRGDITHGTGHAIVDGRHAEEHLTQLDQWARKRFQDATEDTPTIQVSLGDESLFKSDNAWDILQALPEPMITLRGNHEAERFLPSDKFEEATGQSIDSHFMRVGRMGIFMLNPPYYHEAELVPGKNLTTNGLDIADSYQGRIIRNYIPRQHADEMLEAAAKMLKSGKKRDKIDAFMTIGHVPPKKSAKYEEAGSVWEHKFALPDTLVCEGESPFELERDKKGRYKLVHVRKVMEEVEELLDGKVSVGEFYGDMHPKRHTFFEKDRNRLAIMAFSKAVDENQQPTPPQGHVVEVLYDNGEVTITPHSVTYSEKKAQKSAPESPSDQLEPVQ